MSAAGRGLLEIKMKNCIYCGKKIPQARLDALPHTDTCVKCSDEQLRTYVVPDIASEEDLVHEAQRDQ